MLGLTGQFVPASRWVVGVGIAASVGIVSPAMAQQGEVARQRLEESREAIRNLETLQYVGSVDSEGPLLGMIEELNAIVWMQKVGEGESAGWNHRRQGSTSVRNPATGETETVEFDVVREGPNVTYIAHDLRTVFERFHRAARHRSITVAQTGWIGEFADDTPFERELTLPEVTLTLEIGGDTVEGDVCDVVEVAYGDQRQVVRWSISQETDLPRRKHTRLGTDNMQTYTITNIAVDDELPEDIFVMPTPEGYAKNTTVRRSARDVGAPSVVPSYPSAKPFTVTIAEGPGKGDEVSLESLAGNVVILDFWTGWSSTSKDSRSDVQALAEQFKDEPVEVLSMTWRERGRVKAGIDAWRASNATYPLVTGADEVALEYAVSSFPTVFVITKDGKLVFTMSEYNEETFKSSIAEAVQKALDGGFDAGSVTTTQMGGNQSEVNQGNGNQTTEEGGNQSGGNQSGGNQSGGNRPGGNKPQ
ncbi:MAG: TlpA disulfide reductase family protein [Phycisphaerales bacterium]|jgi:thiol-disulfide isomerase/thioredoxin